MAMCKNRTCFFVWDAASEYAINSGFEEVGLVPKVVLGVGLEFPPLLVRHCGGQNSRDQVIRDIGIPGSLLSALVGLRAARREFSAGRMLDCADCMDFCTPSMDVCAARMGVCAARMVVSQVKTDCKELFIWELVIDRELNCGILFPMKPRQVVGHRVLYSFLVSYLEIKLLQKKNPSN